MALNRKEFLKALCLSGACIGCLSSGGEPTRADELLIGDDKKQPLHQAWLGVLLSAMSPGMDKEEVRSVMKRCSIAHFDETSNVLIADENKDHCVCPVVPFDSRVNSSALCYCSEGFAERMFSIIWEKPVSARVISSIRKGDKRCCYEVNVIYDEFFP